MEIGVITWFHYNNYGTKLQTIALQEFLKNNGYSVSLINFFPPESQENKMKKSIKKYAFNEIIMKVIVKLKKQVYKKKIIERDLKMNKVLEKYTFSILIESLDDYIRVCNEYDVLICGSDQIWNPNVFNEFYYASYEGIDAFRLAYAPSVGVSSMDNAELNRLKKSIVGFYNIYMRENTGAQIISNLLSRNIHQVVDPTLLLNKYEWGNILSTKDNKTSKYILCYFLGENHHHWNAVKKFAKEKKIELKIIGYSDSSFYENCDLIIDAGIEDFVRLISNAEYIITDSFHGLVFSLIYNKNFIVFERFSNTNKKSQNSRVNDLLTQIGCLDKLVPYNCREITIDSNYDYDSINNILNNYIVKSKKLLLEDLMCIRKIKSKGENYG